MSHSDPYEFDASLLQSWRVLVVEDEEDSLSATIELFRLLKQQVTGVSSGEAALTKLGEQPFDILCTDINLPSLSGIDLAKQAKSSYPAMALVFATGYGNSARDEIGSDTEVLPKPFGLADIARMLARLAPKLNQR